MGYRSIVGKRFGLGPNGPVYEGRPVGSSMPTGVGRGRTYYVDSNQDGGNGDSPETAAGTLQEIIDIVDTAEAAGYDVKGATIVVLPGHSETITGAGGLTFDVAGLRVIGLGNGSQRPTFLMDGATTVTAVVSAADVYLENLVFNAGHSDIATCFDVDATGFHMVNCEFRENTTHENFLIGITSGSSTDNVCDGLTLLGNKFFTATDSHTSFCNLVGDVDRLHVEGNWYVQGAAGGSSGAAGIFLNGTAGDDWSQALIKDNYVNVHVTATDTYVIGGANAESDNTGLMVGNIVATRQSVGTTGASGQNLFTKGTGFNWIECYHTGKGTLPGKRYPIASDESGWY